MKALVLSVFLTASWLLVTPTNGQDWSPQTPHWKHTVYKLEGQSAGEGGHCSAVVINEHDDIVITAAHCIPEKTDGRSVVVDEKHADVLRWNAVLDLAVLKVPGLGGKQFEVRKDNDIAAGTPISVIGYGFAAKRLKFGFGWVADARDDSLRGVGDRMYLSAAGVVPGDSGGAVVDFNGRLVALEQAVIFAGPSALCVASPGPVIADFAHTWLPKDKTP